MENEDYASESDQSDEDYCPLKEKSEILSEEESGDESSAESDHDGKPSSNASKKKASASKLSKQSITSSSRKRKSSAVEDKPDQPEPVVDDKSHADALWASFLGDSDSGSTKCSDSNPATKKVIVTETVEFAGEQIEVRKEIAVKNNESDLFAVSGVKPNRVKAEAAEVLKSSTKIPIAQVLGGLRKPIGGFAVKSGGGLNAVLGQIGKRNKISVLEKTALDWKSFKHSEGIDEQLQTHNKGKDGYLERQDFLQRTDVRQFEIEKDLRQSKRNHRIN